MPGQNDAWGGHIQSPVIADLDGNGAQGVGFFYVWTDFASVFQSPPGARPPVKKALIMVDDSFTRPGSRPARFEKAIRRALRR